MLFCFFVVCPKLGGLNWPTMSGKARMISYYVGALSRIGEMAKSWFLCSRGANKLEVKADTSS